MPGVTAPWRVRTNAPDAHVGYGTTRGDIFVTAGQWMGASHHWVELTKSVVAADGSDAVNVRLERPLHLVQAYATAFALFGYASAAVELSVVAREGARALESRQQVVRATSVIINPDAPNLEGHDWDFPDQRQPLLFQRPSANPGDVTVGLRVDVFAGGGGFFFTGTGAGLQTRLPDDHMTLEWLWPA